MLKPLLIGILFFCATGLSAQTQLQPYHLEPGDRVNLRVVVWVEDDRQFESWDAVSGEYNIKAEGVLSLPVAGSFQASGQTTTALADEIASSLQSQLGSLERPSIVIEVLSFSPFYVLGDVARPGPYPARPGTTALQAFAIAGGATRIASEGGLDAANNLRDLGSLRQTELELLRARIASIRLAAEVDGTARLQFPDQLRHPNGPEALAFLIEEEREIFVSRKSALEREEATLRELMELLTGEAESIQQKIDGQSSQLELAQSQLTDIRQLVERQLALAQRLTAAQGTVFDLEAKGIDLQNGFYRSQQSLKEAERDLQALQSNFATRSAFELQDVNARIEALTSRREMLKAIILQNGLQVAAEENTGTKIITTFQIQRGTGADRQVLIGPDVVLMPRDVLTVTQTLLSKDVGPD